MSEAPRGPQSAIYTSCGGAAAVALLFWLVTLLNISEFSQHAGVNHWFLLFLYYSLPVWLILWSVFGATTYVYRKVVGVEPEEDQDEDADGKTP